MFTGLLCNMCAGGMSIFRRWGHDGSLVRPNLFSGAAQAATTSTVVCFRGTLELDVNSPFFISSGAYVMVGIDVHTRHLTINHRDQIYVA